MENLTKPEGQTTSDNFLKSEIEKDFARAQTGWGELTMEDESYLGKKGLKTPAELLKSYRALERAYSSKVSLPKDGDKKALDKLYSRLGMPEDSDGFDIEFAKEDLVDGERFKQVCLQNNILPQSAKALYEWYVQNRAETLEASDKSWAENSRREMEEVRRTWGVQAPRNMELMKRGIRLFCDCDDDVADIEQALGTKKMMEMFCKLGSVLSEDVSVSFGQGAKRRDGFNAVEYFKNMFNED